MSPVVHTLTTDLIVIVLAMLVLWLVSIVRHDVSIVDPFWGTGFVIVAWIAFVLNSPATTRIMLLVVLTTVWGLRLSVFLLWRNWGQPEDRRYAAMRAKHGATFWWVSLFTVFLLQGALLWFVSLPIQVAAGRNLSSPIGWLDILGACLWTVGLFFETVGDWQLACFRADPKNAGQAMDRGLWRYTRHPNYFGDFCVWWGLYLIAASGGAAWTFASPLVMSWLLMRISGVKLLESDIVDRRPAYEAYKRQTNAFFPGPKKSTRSLAGRESHG